MKSPECYRKWWLHKWVIPINQPDEKPRFVVEIEWIGPPSGVYGGVILHYSNGEKSCITSTGFRPNKKHVIVIEEDKK